MEVEPGWVEIIPRNRVTLHVRTWLSSAQTDTKSSSDNLTLLILDLQNVQYIDVIVSSKFKKRPNQPVNCKRLEQLWPVTHSLRMVDDNPDDAGTGAVSNLDPVSSDGRLGRQKHRYGSDGVGRPTGLF